MTSTFRLIQLLKIRNQMSVRSLRNYGLYFALILFASYQLARAFGSPDFILIGTMVLATLYAAERQFFPQVKDTMNSIHFLTIPAHPKEKWLSEFIHTFLIIPIIALIPVLLAIYLVRWLAMPSGSLDINWNFLTESIKGYWALHPLLFFGAVYFKQSVLVKTLGSIALLAISSALFVGILTNIIPGFDFVDFAQGHHFSIGQYLNNSLILMALKISYFVFFWGMSYLAFTEVEN